MRVGITIFGTTISPLFDTAQQLLLVELQEGAVHELGKESLSGLEAPDRLSVLKQLGVQVLVCGAINRFYHLGLQERGITVYPWVSGEVSEVLSLLRARWGGGPPPEPDRLAVTVTQYPGQACMLCSVRDCTCLALIEKDGSSPEQLTAEAEAGERWCSKLALLLIDAGAGVLLTKKCGPNALGLLAAAGIQVVSGVEGCLDVAVERYRQRARSPKPTTVEETL